MGEQYAADHLEGARWRLESSGRPFGYSVSFVDGKSIWDRASKFSPRPSEMAKVQFYKAGLNRSTLR
jgi:hypothetical protein